MPITKRTTKVMSYTEQDDDDDFIPIVTNKKNRDVKKLEEKLEQSPVLVIKPPPEIIIEKENISSQSSVSSNDENNTLESEKITETEDLSPKCKRMKHEEEPDISTEQKDSSKQSNRQSSVPLGFPTSKINIPSPHVSRVGLSRKSTTIKPLHPNFTSRVVPE